MKIKKFKKIGNSKYEIELENKESLTLYEDTIIKYNIIYKKEINIDKLNEILEYNDFSKAYEECINYICKKMHSKKEVEEYLENKLYNDVIIKECIKKLENNNMINEDEYTKAYINDRIYLSKDGPNKIKNDLEKLGINQELIEKNISVIDNKIFEDKIKKYIEKKKNINSKYSENMINNKISQELLVLGFDLEMVNKYLTYDYDNDKKYIKKEYEKALIRYSKKYNGKELEQKIKSYLYSKGYTNQDINDIIKEQ